MSEKKRALQEESEKKPKKAHKGSAGSEISSGEKTKSVQKKEKSAKENASVGEERKVNRNSKLKVAKESNKTEEKLILEQSLGEYMAQLLNMPAQTEKEEELLAGGYRGKTLNRALLLAQSVLDKAIEKGDVAAFKEVKALLEEEGESRVPLEDLVRALCESVKKEEKGGVFDEFGNKIVDNDLYCDRNYCVVGDEANLVDSEGAVGTAPE